MWILLFGELCGIWREDLLPDFAGEGGGVNIIPP